MHVAIKNISVRQALGYKKHA